MTEEIQKTLDDRALDYGLFCENAAFAQRIKAVMESSPRWEDMEPYQREALDFIASKIGRLLSGDHRKPDTWHDIAGYVMLVEENLAGRKR